MRRSTRWGWAAVIALLIGLSGCGGGGGGGTNTGAGAFTISGMVTNIAGNSGESGASVQLLNNGAALGASAQTDATGRFTIVGAPSGTFTLQVTRAGATPLTNTIYGPVPVNQDVTNLNIQTVSQADFEAQTGVSPPPDMNSAKVVVVGLTDTGNLVDVTATVNGFPPVGPAAPAEVSLTQFGAFNVTVTGDGVTKVVPAVPVVAGLVTLLDVALTGAPPATAFTVTGAVVDHYSGAPLTGIGVTLTQQNNQVGNPYTTVADGTYLFSNVPAGTDYRLRAEATGYADTVFGPFAVNFDRRGLLIPMASLLDLQTNNGVNAPPDNTTATLVVFAADAQNVQFNPSVSLNGGAAFTNPTLPVVSQNLTPGLYSITVTDPVSKSTATLQNVNLVGGKVTVLQARVGMNNMTTP